LSFHSVTFPVLSMQDWCVRGDQSSTRCPYGSYSAVC
jgi:hypothetical protein